MNTKELVQFQMAYSWMFGTSMNKAKKVYKQMKEKNYQSYINTVINGYEKSFKLAFYTD